jgi:hypothetical protein
MQLTAPRIFVLDWLLYPCTHSFSSPCLLQKTKEPSNQPAKWNSIEHLIVAQPLKNSPLFLEPEIRLLSTQQLVLVLSQMNPDHAFPSQLNFILTSSSQLRLGHPGSLFPSGSSTKTLSEIYFILHTCHMLIPSSLVLSSE